MLKRRTVENAKANLGMCLADVCLQRGCHQRIDLADFPEDPIRLLRQPLATRSFVEATALYVRVANQGGSRWRGKNTAPLLRPQQRAGCDIDRPRSRICETDGDVDADEGLASRR